MQAYLAFEAQIKHLITQITTMLLIYSIINLLYIMSICASIINTQHLPPKLD